MQFSVSIIGTHAEGPDAKARFDKIVDAFTEKLDVNGFIATCCESSHDSEPDLLDVPTPGPNPRPLTGTSGQQAARLSVDFASSAAAEMADANNLTDTDFAGIYQTGDTGFTTFDVREAIAARS